MFCLIYLLFSLGTRNTFVSSHSINQFSDEQVYVIEKILAELHKMNTRLINLNQKQQVSENTNRQLLLEMQTMKERLIAAESDNKKLKKEIEVLKEKESGNCCVKPLTNATENVNHNITDYSTPDANQQNIRNKKRLLMPDSNHRIGFTAVLTHAVTIGYHQSIEFDKVITNVGNAYDPNDGHFIAPVRGLYLLSVTLFNAIANQLSPIEIVRNGIQLGAVHLYHEYETGSQTIIALLETGDKIWVRRFRDQGSATVSGYPHQTFSSFSGVLLFEM